VRCLVADAFAASIQLGIVPSLRDSRINLSQPGTDVPGYRLFRPHSTSSGQALRDCSSKIAAKSSSGAQEGV